MMFNCEIYFMATVALLLYDLHECNGSEYSYEGAQGPEHWSEIYQTCQGKYQSPINIDLIHAKSMSFPPLLFIDFHKQPNSFSMKNNGHTVLINMEFDSPPRIIGGPLNDSYYFSQFHFHWGDNDTYGSEDLINNKSFPIELHMVFFKGSYEDFNNALNFPDGLAVLAYFFELSDDTNTVYENFLQHLELILSPGLETVILESPKLQDFILPDTTHYFTYKGSLTTPPCSEVVTWIDFETPILLSSDQIAKFRNLYSSDGHHLTHNYRPVQPLNGRVVYRNWIGPEKTEPSLDNYDNSNIEEAELILNKLEELNDVNEKGKGQNLLSNWKHVIPGAAIILSRLVNIL